MALTNPQRQKIHPIYSNEPFLLKKTISLNGMMACGKSTIGPRLAKWLRVPFVDSDQLVEKAAGGQSINRIYEQWGEVVFRETEFLVIQRVLKELPVHVLSTGEGAYIHPKTRDLLNEHTITTFLRTDIDIIDERVRKKPRAQLLGAVDTKEALEEIYAERLPIYNTADIIIVSNDTEYDKTVQRIAEAVRLYTQDI